MERHRVTRARPLFLTLKWVGAAYLLVLAVRLWRDDGSAAPEPEAEPEPEVTARRPFLRGVVVDLANPKAALFFTSLFASLLPTRLDAGAAAAVLVATAVIVYGWYLSLALALSRPPAQRLYRRTARATSRVASGVMGALGVRLALA